MRTVVNVRTQEEWYHVTEYYGYKWHHPESKWVTYRVNSCIDTKVQVYGRVSSFFNMYVLSYGEWVAERLKPKKELMKHKL